MEEFTMSIAVSDADFESVVIKSSIPVLVDFWAPWCGPCRGIGPIVEELASDYQGKVLVCKCNVDESFKVPSQFGIRAIPTLIMFKDGEVIGKFGGYRDKGGVKAFIDQTIA